MELISKQAAIEAIYKYCRESCDEYKIGQFEMCDACRLGVAIEHLEAAPTIEAEPVRRGELVLDDYGIGRCSECGTIITSVYRNFCPNCGARMEETK